MGAYGLIRAVAMLPEAAHILQPLLVFLALFGMLYGGLLAWRQSDLKAMVAYSSVSHMGIVLLGIATLNEVGITGSVLQMTAHGLIAGALFLLVDCFMNAPIPAIFRITAHWFRSCRALPCS